MSWDFEPACSSEDELVHAAYGPLMDFVDGYLHQYPEDGYLRSHTKMGVFLNQLRGIRWYLRWLPARGKILDWGCRFAPDSFVLRRVRPELEIHGCDFKDCLFYRPFYEASGLQFTVLTDPFVQPYPDESFEAVIAAGVLEHTAMDYESLKELYRVLKPGGKLIVTHLPYQRSLTEANNRRNGGGHRRLYRTDETCRLLFRSGFYPLCVDYQERVLREEVHARTLKSSRNLIRRAYLRGRRWLDNLLCARRSHAALCGIAEKVLTM